MAVKEDGSFLIGNSENSPVAFDKSGSNVMTVDIAAIQLYLLLNTCIQNKFVPPLPKNVFVDLATVSDSDIIIEEGNWSSVYGVC